MTDQAPIADPLSMFLSAAAAHEQRPAVIEDRKTWTYGELLVLATRLANAIARSAPEQPRVLIHLEQGAHAYASMFATLMAGGCYCPVNLTHPPGRRARVVAMFEPHVVIARSREHIVGLDVATDAHVICVDDAPALPDGTAPTAPAPAASDPLAYVMFTSGSTGEPKGVMVGRAGLGHYTQWAQRAMQLTHEDRWSQHPNIAFDLSVLDIYGALCSGGALVPFTSPKSRLAPASVVRDRQLTIWNSVPSVIDLMIRAGHVEREMLESLRLITFCGEPLLQQHLEAIFEARPDIIVHNTYGPTEATVSMTLVRLDKDNFRSRCRPSVSLGAPIEGMRIDLDNAHLRGAANAAVVTEGEIVITGPQVAFGYWRSPELTRAAFSLGESRSYRTGDWGQLDEGEFYFLARADRQVKRGGYRIELGDVDAAVRAAANTAACTVHVERRLLTFIEGDTEVPLTDLMKCLSERLPPYMMPDEIRPIARFPRSANDKLDVLALERIAADKS